MEYLSIEDWMRQASSSTLQQLSGAAKLADNLAAAAGKA
jgi:hypothetical protein